MKWQSGSLETQDEWPTESPKPCCYYPMIPHSIMTPASPTMVAKDCSESFQKVSMWETGTHLFSLSILHCLCLVDSSAPRTLWEPGVLGNPLVPHFGQARPCSSHQGASGASFLTVPLCQRPTSPKQSAGLSRTELENFQTKTFKDNRF